MRQRFGIVDKPTAGLDILRAVSTESTAAFSTHFVDDVRSLAPTVIAAIEQSGMVE